MVGFYFICNDMIDVNVVWKDGLHLSNNGTNVLANNAFKYLKSFRGNIDFTLNNRNLMD